MIDTEESSRVRAKPLSTDDRRSMIIDAVIPLLMEHGRSVTTRQIADAAGIAEGTIFRVFVDKDALIDAAVMKFLDPAPLNATLAAIDPDLPLEAKINDILFQLRTRMTGIFGIMNAIGMSGPPPGRRDPSDFHALLLAVLAPDLERLKVEPHRVASFLRLIAFASAVPQFNQGQEFDASELAHIVTYGIAGIPAEGGSRDAA